jgi:molybdopterin converting factor subunit 1
VYERLDASRVEPFCFLVAIVRKGLFSVSLIGMTVTVLLFASYAEKLGKSSIPLELGHGATVGDVLTSLQRLPGASRLPTEPLVAVNERYARRDHILASGDEVAIIPPVAGG